MLSKDEIMVIDEAVDTISMSRWAMDKATRMEVARVSSTAILAARGLSAASAEADSIVKDIKDVLGLKTPADARLTHGALGK